MYLFIIFITDSLVILLKIGIVSLMDITFYKSNNTMWLQEHHRIVLSNYFGSRDNWLTSNLGSILLKDLYYPPIDPERLNKTYDIVIWEHGINEAEVQKSLDNCIVQNCIFHNNSFPINESEAVFVDLWNIKMLPSRRHRKNEQKWIFHSAESPKTLSINTRNLRRLGFYRFNWSMTYRTDSDIPILYGRTLPKFDDPVNSYDVLRNLVPHWNMKNKTVLVAAMISNCAVPYRLDLIRELKKYMTVDFYGKCGDMEIKKTCPDALHKQCIYLKKYHFYLALENSLCRQYITEKVFHNAFVNGAIPIIEGAPPNDCEKLLPPHSYIHIDNFPSIEDLAKEILSISENDEKILSYQIWRAHFETTSESGYFGLTTSNYCRLCEAMNYNSMEETYYTMDDLLMFLEPKLLCDSVYTVPRWKSDNSTAEWDYAA